MTWPKTAYLPSRSAAVVERRRRSGCRPAPDRPGCASATAPLRASLLADLGGADRLAARRRGAAPPQCSLRQVARLRIAPLHDEPGHGAMKALAVVEAALHEVDDVRDRFRRLVRIVSNANVPLDVSTTITGAALAVPRGAPRQPHDQGRRHQRRARPRVTSSGNRTCSFMRRRLRCFDISRHADPRALVPERHRRRSADRPAGRRSAPTSPDTD